MSQSEQDRTRAELVEERFAEAARLLRTQGEEAVREYLQRVRQEARQRRERCEG